jgi:L-lactate dehydrogenase complex protein LldF
MSMKIAGLVLRTTWLYRLLGMLARRIVPWLPRFLVYNRFNPWGKQRELPPMPRKSFRQQYAQRYGRSKPPAEPPEPSGHTRGHS